MITLFNFNKFNLLKSGIYFNDTSAFNLTWVQEPFSFVQWQQQKPIDNEKESLWIVESEASGRGPLKKQSTRPRMILLRSLLRHAAQLEKVDASLVYRCSSQLREIRLIELIFERNSYSRAQSLPHDPFIANWGCVFNHYRITHFVVESGPKWNPRQSVFATQNSWHVRRVCLISSWGTAPPAIVFANSMNL